MQWHTTSKGQSDDCDSLLVEISRHTLGWNLQPVGSKLHVSFLHATPLKDEVSTLW